MTHLPTHRPKTHRPKTHRPACLPITRLPAHLRVMSLRAVAATLLLVSLTACASSGGSGDTATLVSRTSGTRTVTSASPTGTSTVTSSSMTTTVTITPTKVTGYSFAKAPASAKALARIGSSREIFSGSSVTTVRKSGKDVGELAIFKVTDVVAASKDAESQVIDGITGGLAGKGSVTKKQQISGQRVVSTTTGIVTVYLWYRDQQLVLLMAKKGSTAARDFVKAYIAAA
jgi:hypothetical protein